MNWIGLDWTAIGFVWPLGGLFLMRKTGRTLLNPKPTGPCSIPERKGHWPKFQTIWKLEMHKLTSARSKPNIWKSPSFFFVGQTQPGLKKKKNFWNIGQLISSRRHSSRNYWIGITPRHYRVILITQNVTQSLSFKSACDWLEMACHVKNTLG